MTQKTIKIFRDEIFSNGSKQNYITNETDVYHIDDTWILDILDLKDYGQENNRNCRYFLVVYANFSKFEWTIPLKNRNAQTLKDFFEIILTKSKRKPDLIETHHGKEFFNKKFSKFLEKQYD